MGPNREPARSVSTRSRGLRGIALPGFLNVFCGPFGSAPALTGGAPDEGPVQLRQNGVQARGVNSEMAQRARNAVVEGIGEGSMQRNVKRAGGRGRGRW